MKNADSPAMPVFACQPDRTELPEYNMGLTKRELFAAMAMQGLLLDIEAQRNPSKCAEWAVTQADALLAELDKPQPTDKP